MEEKNLFQKLFAKILDIFKGMKWQTIIILALSLVVLIGVGALIIGATNKEGQLTTISESSLKEVLEISELGTAEYIYNAVAERKTDDGKKTKFYVAYEGIVTAGIDFNKITFDIKEDTKEIKIVVPAVEIQNYDVVMDNDHMHFIYMKDKYETETVTLEAYQFCLNDLKQRLEQDTVIKDAAKTNAISTVEALFKPWLNAVDSEYKLEVVYGG